MPTDDRTVLPQAPAAESPATEALVADSSDARTPRRRHRLSRALLHGSGLAGIVVVGLVVLAGLLAPLLAPYAPDQQIPGANLLGPSTQYWFGTDAVNRDLFSRTLHGIRVNLLIILVAVPLGGLAGTALGLLSVQTRWADSILQRLFDLILAFPTIVLAIALTVILGPGLPTVFVVVILAEIPIFGRLVRSSAMTVRELPYVESAKAMGAGDSWILRRHILPNSIDPLLVQLTLAMSVAVFIEGAMSFLGLGVTPPTPSLGSLLNEGAAQFYHAPFFTLGPLALVVALTLGLLLISQALARATR